MAKSKKIISLIKAKPEDVVKQRFVEEFCRDFSTRRAAMRVGIPEELADFEGEMALNDPWIREAIIVRLDTLSMSAEEAMARMSDFARASFEYFIRTTEDGGIMIDLSTPRAISKLHMIKKIKQKRTRYMGGEGREDREEVTTEIELHDAKDAVKTVLSVHGKLIEKRTVDVTSGGEKIEQVTVFQLPDNGRD
jgi:CYTH domain-containing protein